MRLAIFTIILATAASTVPAVIELHRKTNATIIPLTKRSSLLKLDNSVDLDALHFHVKSVNAYVQGSTYMINLRSKHLYSKILRGLENYERNTGMSHSLVVKGKEHLNLKNRDVGTTALTSHHGKDSVWYATITIGTPPKSFTVDIDTGSSDLFLPGSTCSRCAGLRRWNPASSRTARTKRSKFDIHFEDGASASGDLYTDNVTIAGFTADIQTIGVATKLSTQMSFPPDGSLGMGFRSISVYPASPFFETLVDKGKVTEPVFSLKVTSNGGELYLGGKNGDLYEGEIIYTPVTEAGHWQVNIKEIQVYDETALKDITAIIDSGSHLIFGDESQVSDLYWILSGESIGDGYYSFPCNEFPTISFDFGGGRTFDIPESILNLGPVRTGSSDCFSGIVGVSGLSHWVLGTIFLQSIYTVFDFGNQQVGFADLV